MPKLSLGLIGLAAMLLSSCQQQADESLPSTFEPIGAEQGAEQGAELERWYTPNQVTLGAQVFADNCSSCHGEKAQGLTQDWKQKLPDGSFPPPPLNGSAHAWHHSLAILIGVINEGGVPLGGKMPGFESSLNEQEKLAVVAYFQEFWSTETYDNWLQMGGTN